MSQETALFESEAANHFITVPGVHREVLYKGTPTLEKQDVRNIKFTDGFFRTSDPNQIKYLRESKVNKKNGGIVREIKGDVDAAEEAALEAEKELGEGEVEGESKYEMKLVEQEGGNAKVFEGVESVAEAFEVLTTKPFRIPPEALHGGNNRPAKSPILKYAQDLGVEFPNLP